MDLFEPSSDGDREHAILLVVSKGLSDFIQNTLLSIERSSAASSGIYIAMPQNAFVEVQTAVSGLKNIKYFFLEDICETDYSWIVKYQKYGSETFGHFTASKWAAIQFLLRSGFQRVTYTDVDVAWMRNPMPMIRAALHAYEIAIQTEGADGFPPKYCTGFMSFRNSEFTIGLLSQLEKLHLEINKTEPKAHDQIVFNRLVANSPGALHRIFSLSELLFANGLNAYALASQDKELENILVWRISPMIFHANWTVGIEDKRLLLQRTGNWLIDHSTRRACEQETAMAVALSRFLNRIKCRGKIISRVVRKAVA
jgi:hypothetical protein